MKFLKKSTDKAEILIYEDIGGDFFGNGVTAKAFTKELKALGDVKEINVRINSTGGDSWDAAAIYNALIRHPATISVDIDGVAASAATYVAMAASPGQLRMAANADFMIHRAWAFQVGDRDDMHKMGDRLEDLDQNQLDVYGKRVNISRQKLEEMLDEETWFTAKEAKAVGLVDEITAELKVAAKLNFSRFTKTPPRVAARFPIGDHEMSETTLTAEMKSEIAAAVKAAVAPQASALESLKTDLAAVMAEVTKPQAKATLISPSTFVQGESNVPTETIVRAEERARLRDLNNLFASAGLKDSAVLDGWIEKGVTVLEAKGQVCDLQIKQNKLVGDDDPKSADKSNDPKAKFRAEYRKDMALYASMGIVDEEQFIHSRMVDEGQAVLVPGVKPKSAA